MDNVGDGTRGGIGMRGRGETQSGYRRRWLQRVIKAVAVIVTLMGTGGSPLLPAVAVALELSATGQPAEFYLSLEPAEIRGFDGVTFGMTPEEVEELVTQLYPDGEREWHEDPVNLTRLLQVTLDALSPVPGVPAVGPAGITYVFGAQLDRLIAINLNWYVGAGRDATPEERQAVLALGTAYVAELLQYEWEPGHLVQGLVVGPNMVVLFAGEDLQGRGVEVTVDGVPLDVLLLPEGIEEHRPIDKGPVRLKIGLAERPADPDIFMLEPGSF